MSTPEKVHKLLAQAGFGSRRQLEEMIRQGRVILNDRIAEIGDRATRQDRIFVDGRPVHFDERAETVRVIAYNKPEGEVCTRQDPEGRPTVFERLPKLKGQRWIAVGRLDLNTSGLLLFTTDGELANRLMHPSQEVDREYAVRVMGDVEDDTLKRLREGVLLEDGMARFSDISFSGGTGINRWYTVTLMEGRNREVRRLWESQNVVVSRLKRVRFGPIFLPSRIKVGHWEELTERDINILYKLVGLDTKSVFQKTPDESAQMKRAQRKRVNLPNQVKREDTERVKESRRSDRASSGSPRRNGESETRGRAKPGSSREPRAHSGNAGSGSGRSSKRPVKPRTPRS